MWASFAGIARLMMGARAKGFLYALLVVAVVTLLGFVGYRYGFLGFIYRIAIPEAFSRFNIVVLSVLFGVAAFFSPCAFSVLPAYVGNYISRSASYKGAKALKLGLLAALGVVSVNVVLGLVVAVLGAAAPFSKDPRTDIPIILAVRALIGLAIAFFGVMLLLGKSVNLSFMGRVLNLGFLRRFGVKADPARNLFWYGALYNGAAIGCTGPILLGLMLYAFSLGSLSLALLSFGVFALTMGLLMLLLTFLLAYFQDVVRRFVPAAEVVRYVAALVMIVVGLSVFLLTLEGNRLFVRVFFPYLG